MNPSDRSLSYHPPLDLDHLSYPQKDPGPFLSTHIIVCLADYLILWFLPWDLIKGESAFTFLTVGA
jgi:hypothetical protein